MHQLWPAFLELFNESLRFLHLYTLLMKSQFLIHLKVKLCDRQDIFSVSCHWQSAVNQYRYALFQSCSWPANARINNCTSVTTVTDTEKNQCFGSGFFRIWIEFFFPVSGSGWAENPDPIRIKLQIHIQHSQSQHCLVRFLQSLIKNIIQISLVC